MAPPSISDLDFIPPDSFGPELLFVIGGLVLGVALGALILSMFVRAAKLTRLRNEANQSLAMNASTPLSEGPSRVVRGRVEPLTTDDVAVELTIVQRVMNHTGKNTRSHSWKEESRSIKATPFLVVQDNGEPVLVEPGENVIIVDSIETEYPTHMPFQRTRKSDVKRGEVVFAYGDLVRGPHPTAQPGYRGPGSGWVLRSPRRDGRMLLATNQVEARYKARVGYLLKAGSILAALWFVFNMFTSVPLVVSTVLGETVPAAIVDMDTYITRSKRSTTTHWRVTARTSDGFTLVRDVPSDTYIALSAARASNRAITIPVIDTLGLSWASYLGTVPYASMALLLIGALAWAITMGAVFATYKERYDWYDKKKLHDPGGNGHWQETRPARA